MRNLNVLFQAVELDAIGIVYVDVLLLRYRKELVVVKKAGIPNGLPQLQFAAELAFPPVHGRDMPFPPRQDQISPVSAVLAIVWTHGIEPQLKALLCHVDGNLVPDIVLANLVGALKLRLGLEEARRILEQNLGLFGLESGRLVL